MCSTACISNLSESFVLAALEYPSRYAPLLIEMSRLARLLASSRRRVKMVGLFNVGEQ